MPVQCAGLFAQLLLALLLLVPGDPLAATEVAGLYQAQVPVADQGAAERKRGMGEAFREVVLKVTERRDVPRAAGRVDASRFVQQFRYLTEQPTEGQATGLQLLVQFDKTAVDGWLHEQGLAAWSGDRRPSTLLWLGLERQGRRQLFVPDLDPSTKGLIQGVAEARGMVLVLPLGDLEDRSRLSAQDLWTDRPETIRAASQRYRPDLVLSGRVSQAGPGRWTGQWTLIQGDRVERWNDQQTELAQVLTQGLDRTADTLAARFPPSTTAVPAGSLSLRVSNVLSLADYLRLRAHLASLGGVQPLALQELEPDAATFRLRADVGRDALAQSLALGGVLTEVPVATPGAGADAPILQYRLSP
jgi:hypothetical protein